MADVLIWGAGGHGKVVMDVFRSAGWTVRAFIDSQPKAPIHGVDVVFSSSPAEVMARFPNVPFVVAIGDNATRRTMYESLHQAGATFATAVHPRAVVHESVGLGPGTVVMAGAVINIDTTVGANSIVNTSASVDHDCVVGDHVHIGPGVHLCGAVHVGDSAFMGVGSCAIPGRAIGRGSTIGAGATVVVHIPDGVLAVGTPARVVRPH